MAEYHTYMTKDGLKRKKLTAVKAIRAKCMECSNWNTAEVRKCPVADCALYPYRMGKRPKRSGDTG